MFEVIVFLMNYLVCLCVKEKDIQMEVPVVGVSSISTDDSLESYTDKSSLHTTITVPKIYSIHMIKQTHTHTTTFHDGCLFNPQSRIYIPYIYHFTLSEKQRRIFIVDTVTLNQCWRYKLLSHISLKADYSATHLHTVCTYSNILYVICQRRLIYESVYCNLPMRP